MEYFKKQTPAFKAKPLPKTNTVYKSDPNMVKLLSSKHTKDHYRQKLITLNKKREKEFNAQYNLQSFDNILSVKLRRKLRMMQNDRLPKFFRRNLLSFYNEEFVNQAFEHFQLFSKFSDKMSDPVTLDLLEDISILLYSLYKARTHSDILLSGVIFLKLRLKSSIAIEASKCKLEQYLHKITDGLDIVSEKLNNTARNINHLADKLDDFEFDLQNDLFSDDTHPALDNVRSMLDNWPKLKKSVIYRKMRRVLAFVISLTMWDDSKKDNGSILIRVEDEEFTSKAFYATEFTYSIAEFVLFLFERGFQCCKLGSFQPIYHSGASYENWYNKSLELLTQSKYLDNPKAFGIDKSQYTNDILKAIDQGKAIYKYAADLDKGVKKIVSQMLFKLNVILAEGINRESLESVRRCPLAVLVSGHSSVAKTTFANILHMYFASLLHKPKGMQYKYTKTLSQEYWEGYSAEKYTVVFDDIALENSSNCKTSPPWLNDIIKVVNNTPIALDMAFEGKGKVPCMAELVIGTTNSPHLFAHVYASCPLAVLRRWALHIHISPKKEYTNDGVMIDPSKLVAPEPGDFPDYWNIDVFEVIKGKAPTTLDADKYRLTATTKLKFSFTSIKDFLVYYGRVITNHCEIQDKVILGDRAMSDVDVCPHCFKFGRCKCIEIQSEEFDAPSLSIDGDDASDIEVVYSDLPNLEDESDDEDQIPQIPRRIPNFREYFRPKDVYDRNRIIFKYVFEYTMQAIHGIIACIGVLNWIFATAFLYILWDYVIPFKVAFQMCRIFIGYPIYWAWLLRPRWFHNIQMTMSEGFYSMSTRFLEKAERCVKQGKLAEAAVCKLIHHFGCIVFETFKTPILLLTIITVLSGMLAAWWMRGSKVLPEVENQGNLHDIGSRPSGSCDEKESTWVKPSYELTSFDFNRKITSWKGIPKDQVDNYLEKNVVYLSWHRDEIRRTGSVAVCLAGNFYLTTNHTVPEVFTGVDVKQSNSKIVHCKLGQSQITRYIENDLCLIEINSIPAKRSIRDLFSPDNFSYEGKALFRTRLKDGNSELVQLDRAFQKDDFENVALNITQPMYFAKCSYTKKGMCGSIMYAHTDLGPVILGIHQVGSISCCGAIRVTQSDIIKILDEKRPIEPSVPELHGEILFPVHHKSPINFVHKAQVDVYGTLGKWRPSPNSRVSRTLACNLLIRDGYDLEYGKPIMSGWQPWYRAFNEIIHCDNSFDENYIEEAKDSMIERWSTIPISERNLELYDIKTCVNGYPGCKFVDKINRTTSAGFPFRETKKRHFIYLPPDEVYQDPIEFTQEIHDMVQKRYDLYQNYQQSHPIFIATLKDEPLKFKKIKIFKTRVFYGGPVDFTIIVRMALLSFLRLSMNNPLIFEASPGINAHGQDWSDLYKYLTKFGEHRMIFGDFSDYDITMRASLILHAFKLIEQYHLESGCSQEHLNLIRGIAYDVAYPLVDFNGTLITMYGKNPSGQPLTVVINGLINCIYMRYCYRSLNPLKEVKTFNKNVNLTTYGDDNGQGVTSEIDWYNHTNIARILKDNNVTYTMADKTSISKEFIHISEADFLKRKWRFDDILQEYMAPLEISSIIKSLMIGVKSKAITNEVHIVQIFHSAMMEFAHHGILVYEEWFRRLNSYIIELNLGEYFSDKPLLSHEEMLDVYFRNDLSLQGENYPACKCGKSQCCLNQNLDCTRICQICLHCRFDDIEIDCPNCGLDDFCKVCYDNTIKLIHNPLVTILQCTKCKAMLFSSL